MSFLEDYLEDSYADQTYKTMINVIDFCRDIERKIPGEGVKSFHEIVQDNFKDQPEAMATMIASIVDYDRDYVLNVTK